MLSGLVMRSLSNRESSYARRPDWTRPVESLWAIVAKWQFINRLPFSTLAKCLSSSSRDRYYLGVDLRVLEAFDLDALTHFSGIQYSALCAGACAPRWSSDALILTCTNLRWCRACMNEGFHATLFQFTPITFCPIHGTRLIHACPACHSVVPYRLDAAAAANPLACPSCYRLLVSDPTVLLRPYRNARKTENLLDWQRLLTKYAHWYSNLISIPRTISGEGAKISSNIPLRKDRLAFVGALQGASPKAPVLSSNAELRASCAVSATPTNESASNTEWLAPFTKGRWPHFQSKAFADLCRLFCRLNEHHRKSDDPTNCRTTWWWRRAWQGATARTCSAHTTFDDPPFGVAEWIAFSPEPDSKQSPATNHFNLVLRFEEDLQITWHGWSELLKQMPTNSPIGLHPKLVPPRSCWLNEPQLSPCATALGF